ncbi:MAG: hypothetical protein ACTSQJ_09350 [Promethearchaeota archaeon]
MTAEKNDRNPHELCIFRSKSECVSCPLKNELDCHFDGKKLLRFVSMFLITLITSLLGLIFNGFIAEFIVYLILIVVFSIIFFEFWEIRILCSHCPFYAEKGKKLRCYANYGSYKAWKYHPEPMSKSEKIQLMIGFFIFFGLLLGPSIFLILKGIYLWAIFPIIGFITFLIVIKKYHCPKCFNFSCPLNRKSKEVIDAFLKLNHLMKEAWEKAGWKIEN